MPAARNKKIALIAGVLFALAVVTVIFLNARRSEEPPIEVKVAEVQPNKNAPEIRDVKLRLQLPKRTHVLVGGLLTIETRLGSIWVTNWDESRTAALSPYLLSMDEITLPVMPGAEALRLRYTCTRLRPLPFGIGDPRTRLRKPQGISGWLQTAVRKISRPAFEWLWPGFVRWKIATLEVTLPKPDPAAPLPAYPTNNPPPREIYKARVLRATKED